MIRTARQISIAAVVLLPSCQGTKQMYDGEARPAAEIAVVEAANRSFGASVADGLTSPFSIGLTMVEAPDHISIVSVDGEGAKSKNVELLPGPHTIVASGSAQPSGRYQRIEGLGQLEFQAAAGQTYTLTGKWSKHSPPWAFELREKGASELLASSEPRFEDLLITAPDLGGGAWDLAEWKKVMGSESLSYTQNGESVGQWTQLVEVLRMPLEDPSLSLEEAAEQMAKAKRKAHASVDLTYADGLWTERWASTWKRKSKWQWGVTVGTVEVGFMNLWVYASREPFDEALQREWEARFRASR